jgi:hypothetical protein
MMKSRHRAAPTFPCDHHTINTPPDFDTVSLMVVIRAPKPWQKTANTRKSTFKKTDCMSELGIDEIEWSRLDFQVHPTSPSLTHCQMVLVRNEVMKVPPCPGISLNDLSKDQFTSLAEICFDEASKQVEGVGYRLDNPVSQTPLSINEEKKWLKDVISTFFSRQWNNAKLERLKPPARRKVLCHACGQDLVCPACEGMGEVTPELQI